MLNEGSFRRLAVKHLASQLSCLFLACFLVLVSALTPVCDAQTVEKGEKGARKVITQVAPDYPPDLKRAAIGGVVRLNIVVTPRGSVDFVEIAGGNPILADSAVKAVKQWKYAPASLTTNIRVIIHFDPAH